MQPFIRGFVDELTKVAGPVQFLRRLEESPELRHAIRRSTLLGAGTGAITGALQSKKDDESRLKKILGGAAIGGIGGAITGGAFPGWFDRRSMRAVDEH